MTIHRDWIGVMKEECPTAFTQAPPFVPKVAFLDGMPLLMKSSHITRWADLVKFNFVRPVKRFLCMGAPVVVLAFDAYEFVPAAKSITQANRSKNVVKCGFDDRSQLPTVVPLEYNDFMRNRAFKRRVVHLVVETIPDLLGLRPGQTVIVDYESCPIKFTVDPASGKVVQDFMVDIPPLGECDIKFTRWVKRYGDCIAHSVDGDFIPIALIHHETELRALQGATEGSQRRGPSRVAIFRLEFGAAKEEAEGDTQVASRKRELQGSLRQQAGPQKSNARKRPMEYVFIPMLYESMFIVFRQFSGTGYSSRLSHDTRYMEMLACLIGLTGTDFTRNLPFLGVKKLWSSLATPGVWSGLLRAYDVEDATLSVRHVCDMLVARLYSDTYSRHVTGHPSTLEEVLACIRSSSKISDRTKRMLPDVGRVEATAKNINWLLMYWRCVEPSQRDGDWSYRDACPDPVSEEYGFSRGQGGRGAVRWLDENWILNRECNSLEQPKAKTWGL